MKSHQQDTYKPHLTVRNSSTTGFAHRVFGWKSGRVHHFQSNLELYFFYWMEWKQEIVNIREKFRLPVNRTTEIAKLQNIYHPCSKDKKPKNLCTDFLLDKKSKSSSEVIQVAVSVVYNGNKMKHAKRMLLEKIYWKQSGVRFIVMTEKEIPMSLVRNVEFIHSCRDDEFAPLAIKQYKEETLAFLLKQVRGSQRSVRDVCSKVEDYFGFQAGTAMWLVKHCIANRILIVDMHILFDETKPLAILTSKEETL